jgi:hypothetical protein
MKFRRSEVKSILPKTVSAVLVFWLSSVLVLVCCSPHLFTASVMKMDESCPMQKGHECCNKNKDAKSLSETKKINDSCCVFKPTKTLSADLQTVKITKQTKVATEKVELPKPVYFIQTAYKSTKIYHSAIRNRGSTYIQNCVFRI